MDGNPIPKLGKAPKSPQKGLKRTGFKKGTGKQVKRAINDSVRSRGSRRKVKSPLQKAKATLWELCKQIIRKRHGNICYTCGKTGLEGGNWHTAHFIPSSTCSAAMRYDLDNLRPGCYHCNVNLSGNWVSYEEHLKKEKGEDFPDSLKERNRDTKNLKYDLPWYLEKIIRYKRILEGLSDTHSKY